MVCGLQLNKAVFFLMGPTWYTGKCRDILLKITLGSKRNLKGLNKLLRKQQEGQHITKTLDTMRAMKKVSCLSDIII